jgi:hypothetical protein
MRRLSLSKTGNIVLLPLDREECNAPDVVGSNQATAMEHRAFRKRMFDKNRINRLQIEFRRDVHDGEIFVVELPMAPRGFTVTTHQVHKHSVVRANVSVKV